MEHATMDCNELTCVSHDSAPHSQQKSAIYKEHINEESSMQQVSFMLNRTKSAVRPTSAQLSKWERLKLACLEESQTFAEIAQKNRLLDDTVSAAAKLELRGSLLFTQYESYSRLQPLVLGFYLQLNEQQRFQFDANFSWPLV